MNLKKYYDLIAEKREWWVRLNWFYYQYLTKLLDYNLKPNSRVMELGCNTGFLMNMLFDRNPERVFYGYEISNKMISIAKKTYPHLNFKTINDTYENPANGFDDVIINDTFSYVDDIQKTLHEVRSGMEQNTRVHIIYHNPLWRPFFKVAERLGLKMQYPKQNWLNYKDIQSLLALEDFEVVKFEKRLLIPFYIPIVSNLINKYIINLPLLSNFALISYIVARPINYINKSELIVSVIVPARNEKGNIEQIVKKMPKLGRKTEIIFIEGHSNDGTYEEIVRVAKKYEKEAKIKFAKQPGKGKADAVRIGFDMATGDLLMIEDADMTVDPDDLIKFYNAYVSGKGEYVQGTRLIYPMEDKAMRLLNFFGNKFFSFSFSKILNQRISDTLCGTKVISKSDYNQLVLNRKFFGDFDPFGDFDLIFGAVKLNLKLVEIPIRYRARKYGTTNISRFKHGLLLIRMLIFAFNKIKLL